MYEVVLPSPFRRDWEKEAKRNPKLWAKVRKTLRLLSSDIKHPSLRLHKLSGLEYWSVSIDQSYRIKIRITDKYIFCIKFGTHEEIY
ncbi:MAG: plasmid stabilization protein [Candidatus Woesebacteria bacterium]|nr:plasmid stabilization protein [Candidatus Woesebacteria bacterium]